MILRGDTGIFIYMHFVITVIPQASTQHPFNKGACPCIIRAIMTVLQGPSWNECTSGVQFIWHKRRSSTMPSDLSTWLISVPQSGDSEGLLQELSGKLTASKALAASNIAELQVPSLKVRS